MYELSLLYPAISGVQPEFSWSGGYARTTDGLPVVGPHRNFPRHLFALGFSAHSLGLVSAAARMLVRHAAGRPARGDDLLGFARLLD
jgi:glycine/D-amino acid oxidase-like deaminating enzyme